jgi:hypothetical protein
MEFGVGIGKPLAGESSERTLEKREWFVSIGLCFAWVQRSQELTAKTVANWCEAVEVGWV